MIVSENPVERSNENVCQKIGAQTTSLGWALLLQNIDSPDASRSRKRLLTLTSVPPTAHALRSCDGKKRQK